MYRAMIPNPNAPELPVPTPLNGASLAAIADAAAGDFLLASKKSSEALPYFQRAAALGRSPTSGTPRVSNARGDSNFSADATGPAVAHALLMLAQIALSHNDGQTAMNYLNAAGGANPTAEQRTQINDLQMQNARLMNNANNR